MYEELAGKKLLILGAYSTEIEIIDAAKELGLYTIVTDNHDNWDDAPAKYESNEALNISWSDINALKDYCEKEDVDGVLSGFSENRVLQGELLSRAINKPFYADGADLDTILDKLKFKKACADAGLVVPRKYCIDDEVEFPVIVKPADNGGSRGITICYTKEDLSLAYEKAILFSKNKKVVIEEYINADDVMVFFNVHNGIADFSAMCDRIMVRFDERITQLPVGYMYPSKHINTFITYNLKKFKKLIYDLRIKNGLIAFQSFVRGNDVIPFDPTYRLDGTTSYHITDKCTGVNSLKMLISYSLTGKMGDDEYISTHENPFFKKYCFQLPVLLKSGTIAHIEGIDRIREMDDVIHVRQLLFVGDQLDKKADFSQMLCRIHMVSDSLSDIEKNISDIFDYLKVYGRNNEDLILYRYESGSLLSCYKDFTK